MTDLDTAQVLLLPQLPHDLHGLDLRKVNGKPGQGAVRVGVCPFALNQLGEFTFAGIRQGPAGDVKVEITFDVSVEGILTMTAKDPDTGKDMKTTVRVTQT